MSGEGVESIEKKGAQLHGTFGPGQHTIDFRWQLPYAGEKEVEVRRDAHPARGRHARDGRRGSQDMSSSPPGFPEAEATAPTRKGSDSRHGASVRREDPPLTKLHVELRDLPRPAGDE